jgi:hypothetical protein
MIDRLASVLAKVTLGFFFLFLFFAGVLIGGTALHDPDTCWLVALGKYIFEHGGIPTAEPFSYTFADIHRPLVLYQWLTELCFFGAVKTCGLRGLLVLTSTLVMIAFAVIPLKMFALLRARWYVTLPMMLLAMVSACFHFLARPEIVSYVLLSFSLFILTLHRLEFRQKFLVDSGFDLKGANGEFGANLAAHKGPDDAVGAREKTANIDYKLILILAIAMLSWSNFHTGFVSGLLVLATYVVASLISRFLFKVHPLYDLSGSLALLAGVAATLCNPYGIGLWQYIPSLFFANFNRLIVELNSADIRKPEFVPFALFLAGFFVFWLKRLLSVFHSKEQAAYLSAEKMQCLESSIIFCVCAFEGTSHLRLIPFVVLVLLYEFALLIGPILKSEQRMNLILDAFNSRLAAGLAPPLKLGGAYCLVLTALVGIFGTLTGARIQAPQLPQSGGAFKLPVTAMEEVSSKHAAGHILNDPQYGDALIWYHPDAPKVFVDTRFDMYGEDLIKDYLCMRDARPGFIDLLAKYDIKTIFLPVNTPLILKLRGDSSWKVDYSDKDAVVLSRL